eukprot:g5944.t1 g5944   contig20:477056-477607(+)
MTTNTSLRHIILVAMLLTTTSALSSTQKRSNSKPHTSTFATTHRSFAFALTCGAHRMFSTRNQELSPLSQSRPSENGSVAGQSSTSLNFRSAYDEDYTDSLWQSALRPEQAVQQVSISRDSKTVTLIADPSVPLELRPLQMPVVATASKDSSDGLIETAKAFIPVVIEVGFVAAVAANTNLLN